MNPGPGTGLGRAFPALQSPQVRRYMLGHLVSMHGVWMQSVTLNLVAWQFTQAPLLLGLLNFLLFGPSIVVSPLAGPRLRRETARDVAAWAMGASALISLLFAACVLAGPASGPWLVLLAALAGVVNGIEMPARQLALTAWVREPSHIAGAVSLNTVGYNLARMAGPALAAGLFALVGASLPFLLSAGAALFMLGCLRSLPAGSAAAAAESAQAAQRDGRGLRAALGHVLRDRKARLFVPLVALTAFFGGAYQTLLPILGALQGAQAARWTGIYFAVAGLGALLASVTLSSRLAVASRRRLQVLAPWAAALAMVGAGLAPHALAALPALFAMGFGVTFTGPGTSADLQQHAPEHLRGALAGLFIFCFAGMMPLGNLAMGALAQVLPVRACFAAMGLAALVVLAASFGPRWVAAGRIELDADRL